MPEQVTAPQMIDAKARVAAGAKEGSDTETEKQKEYREAQAGKLRVQAEAHGPRSTLESFRERLMDEDAVLKHIDSNIGTKDEKGNITRTRKETARRTRARNAEGVARNIIQKDWVDLSASEKTALRNSALEAFRELPGGPAVIESFNADPLGLEAFLITSLDSLDKDGVLKDALVNRYKEVFSGERSVDPKLAEAKAKITEIEGREGVLKQQAKDNIMDVEAAQKVIEDFEDNSLPPGVAGPIIPGHIGPKAAELNTEQARVEAFMKANKISPAQVVEMKRQMEFLPTKIDVLRAQIDGLNSIMPRSTANDIEIAKMVKELGVVAKQYEKAQRILPGYDTVAARRDELQAEKDGSKAKLDEALAKGSEISTKVLEVQREKYGAQADLERIKLESADGYVKDAQGIMKDALKELYEDRWKKMDEHDDAVLKKMIDDETDPAAKKVLQEVQDGRWREITDKKHAKLGKIPIIGGKFKGGTDLGHGEVERFNKDNIQADINMLRAQAELGTPENGPRMVVQRMLEGMKDGSGNNLYTPDQIKELLDSDKFKTDVIPTATNRLLAAATKENMVSQKDTEMIKAALGQDAFDKAIAANKEWFDKQKKEHGFVGSTADFIKKHPKFGWWLALTIMFPAAGILVGGAVAGKNILLPAKKGHGHAKPELEEAA